LDTDAPGFSRDQFGRQSMSEKRHASLDAKNTDTYQRNKKLRSVVVLFFPPFCFIVTKREIERTMITQLKVYGTLYGLIQCNFVFFVFSFNIL
jgi:hypothetical protein